MSDDFFDSEDPHPITADESHYGYDDFPTPRASQSRKSTPAKPVTQGVVKKRAESITSSSPKRNSQRLSAFVQTVQEMSPLIYLAHHQNSGEFESASFEEGFSALIGNHQILLAETCDRLGLSQEDLGDRFIVSQLAMRLSKVAYKLRDLPTNIVYESVGLSINQLDKWISQNTNILRDMVVQERAKSNDILVNVKLGLFSPTINLYGIYEKWKAGVWREVHASKLMDLAVDFAKDMSFNWDKSANFRDKHDLFQGVLELCANLVIDVYETHIIQNLKLQVEEEYSFEHNGLGKFHRAFDDLDMGYKSHDSLNESWLLNKVRVKKESLLMHYMPVSVSDNETFFIEKFIVMQIDGIISSAWVKAAETYINKVSDMPEDDRDDFLSSEIGQQPMPFNLFEEELEKLRPRGFDLISQNLNLQEVAHQSRKLLAEMWGISDAFCKISKQ